MQQCRLLRLGPQLRLADPWVVASGLHSAARSAHRASVHRPRWAVHPVCLASRHHLATLRVRLRLRAAVVLAPTAAAAVAVALGRRPRLPPVGFRVLHRQPLALALPLRLQALVLPLRLQALALPLPRGDSGRAASVWVLLRPLASALPRRQASAGPLPLVLAVLLPHRDLGARPCRHLAAAVVASAEVLLLPLALALPLPLGALAVPSVRAAASEAGSGVKLSQNSSQGRARDERVTCARRRPTDAGHSHT